MCIFPHKVVENIIVIYIVAYCIKTIFLFKFNTISLTFLCVDQQQIYLQVL